MKAVILAAGRGLRLLPLTETLPKCLIEIGGAALLERSLARLHEQGLRQAFIVTGHLGSMIRTKLGRRCRGVEITYVENPEYTVTGSMYSLSRLEFVLDEDIVLLDSDLLYSARALELVLSAPASDALLTTPVGSGGDHEYVSTRPDNSISGFGRPPRFFPPRAAGCLAGISKLSAPFLELLFARARQDYAAGLRGADYEQYVLRTGLQEHDLYAVPAPGLAWTNVDTRADLINAVESVLLRA